MRVTVLGCGGSGGVPLVGNNWGNCDPANPKNRRRRVSILVEEGGALLLVDTSPDLREQLLSADVTRLDAVLYTHHHADHSHGLDDLRTLVYSQGRPIDAYMDAETHRVLTARFAYAFTSTHDGSSLYRPLLRTHVIEGPVRAAGIEVISFAQRHGPETTFGYRLGPLAYSTDAASLDEAAFAVLEGVQVWIVDCLRYDPHPTHSHFEQTLSWIARVRPRRAVLTHMNQALDYEELRSRCPSGVEPAYDGMVIEVAD
jgi:phosphoribosyl 1,2-cyclic phosphate phosphodiesterase